MNKNSQNQSPDTILTDNNKVEGMPDIANDLKSLAWRPALITMAALLVVILMAWFIFYGSHDSLKKQSIVEEQYSVPEASSQVNTDEKKSVIANPIQQVSETTSELNENQQHVLRELEKERQARLQAPVLVVNQSISNNPNTDITSTGSIGTTENTHDTSMLTQQKTTANNPQAVQATTLGNRSILIAEGTIIHGVLETAIQSDLPGMLRAIVSEPVYAEDGSRVLIAPGSRLIGEYRAQPQQGQTRLLVVWNTLIQPNGTRIQLTSPGTNNLGVAGMAADSIDHHFLERFGTVSLLSLIGAGTSTVGVNSHDSYNAMQSYRQAVASSFTQSAKETYQQQGNISPTLHIHQGMPIMVFVARPLAFDTVIKSTQKKAMIF